MAVKSKATGAAYYAKWADEITKRHEDRTQLEDQSELACELADEPGHRDNDGHADNAGNNRNNRGKDSRRRKKESLSNRGEVAPPTGESEVATVIHLRPLDPKGNIWTEQNLGCELPICVPNRHQIKDKAIEYIDEEKGRRWRLVRSAEGSLPSPEAYRYWLWFIDRCIRAAADGHEAAPWIDVNPRELCELFGNTPSGSRYRVIDDAFTSFADLRLKETSAFYDAETRSVWNKTGTVSLCDYESWRRTTEKQERTYQGARIRPGAMLWSSIKANYIKALPFEPLKDLSYIAQRLYTYISKHCRPGGSYTVNIQRMLPKIPLSSANLHIRRTLGRAHTELATKGFLLPLTETPPGAQWSGRGKTLTITYRRPSTRSLKEGTPENSEAQGQRRKA
jgi:hypothetical protein